MGEHKVRPYEYKDEKRAGMEVCPYQKNLDFVLNLPGRTAQRHPVSVVPPSYPTFFDLIGLTQNGGTTRETIRIHKHGWD